MPPSIKIEPEDELELIRNMLGRAKAYGLECEVIQAFGNYRATRDNPEQAISAALYDWDL